MLAGVPAAEGSEIGIARQFARSRTSYCRRNDLLEILVAVPHHVARPPGTAAVMPSGGAARLAATSLAWRSNAWHSARMAKWLCNAWVFILAGGGRRRRGNALVHCQHISLRMAREGMSRSAAHQA